VENMQEEEKGGQSPFAGTAPRVLRTKGDCPPFSLDGTVCLEKLRRQIARLETGSKRRGDDPPVPSGCPALDDLLPERGFRRGALVEWFSAGEGVGAGTLALLAAKHACCDGGILAVFDLHQTSKETVPFSLARQLGQSPRREFFPPAAVRLGIEPEQLLVIHAVAAADNHWAIDQALRSPAVAAVLAWPERIDDRTFRRWQLSAEEGGCLAMLLRPEAAKSEPSWADVRLLVEPLPVGWAERSESHQGTKGDGGGFRRDVFTYGESQCRKPPPSPPCPGWQYNRRLLRITLLRCRGKNAGRGIDVELDDETYRVHLFDRCRRQVAN
jgi:protein ImuA